MFEKLKKQNYKFWNFCQKIFRNWYLKHEIQKIRAFLFKIYLSKEFLNWILIIFSSA